MTRSKRADGGSDDDDLVVRIGLDNGGPEGENSAYLLPDRGIVVDPGPPTQGAWEQLTDGLATAGLSVGDIDWVLVTHWHADHAGLAPRLANTANAKLAMHELDAPLVADYAVERERRVERDARQLREWGVSDAVVDALQSGDRPSPVPDSMPVRELRDGETIAGLEVIHTPGHTLGHAAFGVHEECEDPAEHDGSTERDGSIRRDSSTERGSTILIGDLVLPNITPNVGGGDTRLWSPSRDETNSRSPLATYIDSLGRVQRIADGHDRQSDDRLDADRPDASQRPRAAYPGHGSSLDLAKRISAIRSHHDQRRRRVRALVTEASTPVTPWSVATELFGEMDGIHAKMGAGEAASHLAWLRERGAVDRVRSNPVRYRPVDGDDQRP